MKKVVILLVTLTAGLPASFLNNKAQASPVAEAVPAKNIKEAFRSIELNVVKLKGAAADLNNWELPNLLKEVSGIKYIGNDRFACIQEKRGSIFIYNTATGEIEKEIPFSESGNFEGIAIADKVAYVVQSNGEIYEVLNYQEATPIINQYSTALTSKQSVEGLTYDKQNNRLLLAIQGDEPRNNSYKGIYAFDLKSKKMVSSPVVRINLNDPFIRDMNEKKGKTTFQPSAIEIHPKTNDIYILQSNHPKLLVMDAKGHIKKIYTLERSEFPYAESLAFSPKGDLFISNEGRDGAATILKVTL